MRYIVQGFSFLGSNGLLNRAFQNHIFHDFFNPEGKTAEYTQEMHNSHRDFHRRALGLTPGGPLLENFGLGGALSSFWHAKHLVLIEINNKNKPNRTLKNDLSKSLKLG